MMCYASWRYIAQVAVQGFSDKYNGQYITLRHPFKSF